MTSLLDELEASFLTPGIFDGSPGKYLPFEDCPCGGLLDDVVVEELEGGGRIPDSRSKADGPDAAAAGWVLCCWP